LMPATALWHDPAFRDFKQAHYQVHGTGVAATRDIAMDTGWVGGVRGKRGRAAV
jgi:hypothetical protein